MYAGIGITAGSHRLWAHRAYKAKLPMRALLASMQSAAFQVVLDTFYLLLCFLIVVLNQLKTFNLSVCLTSKIEYFSFILPLALDLTKLYLISDTLYDCCCIKCDSNCMTICHNETHLYIVTDWEREFCCWTF